jgi:hypothetical protein
MTGGGKKLRQTNRQESNYKTVTKTSHNNTHHFVPWKHNVKKRAIILLDTHRWIAQNGRSRAPRMPWPFLLYKCNLFRRLGSIARTTLSVALPPRLYVTGHDTSAMIPRPRMYGSDIYTYSRQHGEFYVGPQGQKTFSWIPLMVAWIQTGRVSVVGTATRLNGRWIEPGGGEIFRTRPDRPWGPPSLLYNGYRLPPPPPRGYSGQWPSTAIYRRV